MQESDPAARRYWLLQLARFAGAAVAVLGAMIVTESLDGPRLLGGALLIAGTLAFFVVPVLLARRWRSPPP